MKSGFIAGAPRRSCPRGRARPDVLPGAAAASGQPAWRARRTIIALVIVIATASSRAPYPASRPAESAGPPPDQPRWRVPDPCRRGSAQPPQDAPAVIRIGKSTAQPVQRLDHPHRRAAGPEQLAWRRRPEGDDLLPELDGAQARVRMHDDPPGHGVTEAEIVGGRHAIDQHPGLIAPRHGLDHAAIIRDRHLAGQPVRRGRS